MKEGRASRTAEYMALFRALESTLPEDRRLFADPFAATFLTPRSTSQPRLRGCTLRVAAPNGIGSAKFGI